MAQIARDAGSRIDVAPARALSRLGRRAVTPILGLAYLSLSFVADRIDVRPLRRALNWLALRVSSPAIPSESASIAATHRRNLASLLTEYWYGESRVTGVERGLGQMPTDRYVARAFLAGLAARFEEAGLPTWPIDPRHPRAIDNLCETGKGVFKVVDLESGVVSPLPSLKTWFRALRRGLAPSSDVIFFDVTRAYITREEERMRARFGDAWVEDLHATLDAAESDAVARRRGAPRLRSRNAGGHEQAQGWLARIVADALAQRAPWNLSARSGSRHLVARPTPFERLSASSKAAGDAGPIWQLGRASSDRRSSNVGSGSPSDSPLPARRCLPTPAVLSCSPQPRAA
jgi:hypothetical protein